MPPKGVKMASRYKRSGGDDGDDDDDGEAALMLASMGPPALVMVFEIPDEDQVFDEDEIQRKQDERDNMMAKLRKLELNVEQQINRNGDKLFLKISAPDDMLQRRAEQRGIRLQLDIDKFGGAMCAFSRKLYRVTQQTCFAPPADGCQPGVFSSLVQLDIADEVVRSEPWDDGTGMNEPINPEELMEEGVIVPNGYFLLHYERARAKLLVDWAAAYLAPQPLEDVRAYFGEKYALFFTFFGSTPPLSAQRPAHSAQRTAHTRARRPAARAYRTLPPLVAAGSTRRCCGFRRCAGRCSSSRSSTRAR
jgi:hypothetical protein